MLSLAAGVAVSIALVQPADARRVSTDSPWPQPEAGLCLLNQSIPTDCSAIDLGFGVNIGGTVYSSVFVYDDGLVSFGGPVADPAATTADGFGTPVIISDFVPIEELFGPPFVTPRFSRIWSQSATSLILQWYEGEVNFIGGVDPDDPEQLLPGSFTTLGVLQGFQFLTLQRQADGRIRATVEGEGPFLAGYGLGSAVDPIQSREAPYSFLFGGAVPEPASWALMIAGFGLVGAAARRRRRPARA